MLNFQNDSKIVTMPLFLKCQQSGKDCKKVATNNLRFHVEKKSRLKPESSSLDAILLQLCVQRFRLSSIRKNPCFILPHKSFLLVGYIYTILLRVSYFLEDLPNLENNISVLAPSSNCATYRAMFWQTQSGFL